MAEKYVNSFGVSEDTNDTVRLNQIIDGGLNIYGSREKIRFNLVQLAKNYLNIKDGDITKTSYLAYIIDVLSILTSNQIYYQSRIYNEFFMVSADMNESVQNLAKWIGYTIPKAVCADVNIMFTMPLSFTGASQEVNFNFPRYFKCMAQNIPFTIKSNFNVLDTSSSSATVAFDVKKLSESGQASYGKVLQNSILTVRDYNGYYRPVYVSKDGKTCSFTLPFTQCEYVIRTFNIPVSLQANQFYTKELTFEGQVADLGVYIVEPTSGQTLDLSSIDAEKITNINTFDPNIEIKDSAGQNHTFKHWKESVNGIYTMSSTSEEYGWVGYYNKGTISFGNGILGKQPQPGSYVVCVLKLTRGADGNVIANTINNGQSLNVAIAGGSYAEINYECTNLNAASNGSDILATSEIKNNAIVNLASKKRLVSDYDYDNANTVIENNVLSDCVPILKRSDIKINEICMYFLLNYIHNGINEIVPTRSVTLNLVDPVWDENGKCAIDKFFECDVGKEKLPFMTIFNMVVDRDTRVAFYNYTCSEINGVSCKLKANSVYDTLNSRVFMNSTQSSFTVDYNTTDTLTKDKPMYVKFDVTHLSNSVPDSMSSFSYKWTAEDICKKKFEIMHFKAYMTTKWDNFDVYDDESDDYIEDKTITSQDGYTSIKYNSFMWKVPNYIDVPLGKQRYEFQVLCYAPKRNSKGETYIRRSKDGAVVIGIDNNNRFIDDGVSEVTDPVVMEWQPLKAYYSDAVVRQDLSDCMASNITCDYYLNGIPSEKIVYHIHDVPMIYKNYYKDVTSVENNMFETNVLQKLLDNVFFSNKRMMTDFTNVKFGDTYGPLTNLKYNEPNYIVESRYANTPWWKKQQGTEAWPEDIAIYNPEYEKPLPTKTGVYYIVNGKVEDLGENTPTSEYMGYIAYRYVQIPEDGGDAVYTYSLIKPSVGTIVKIKDELDTTGFMQTCYWTGSQWKCVEDYSIPLNMHLKVEINESKVSASDDAIRENIIDALSEYFMPKMGLQKTLDRSEVIKVCRSVSGVEYAQVLEPEFDIKFDYVVNDLTQEQLLEFTPQYVGFRCITDTNKSYDNTSITIDVVRK